jgi:hypothetical protein
MEQLLHDQAKAAIDAPLRRDHDPPTFLRVDVDQCRGVGGMTDIPKLISVSSSSSCHLAPKSTQIQKREVSPGRDWRYLKAQSIEDKGN